MKPVLKQINAWLSQLVRYSNVENHFKIEENNENCHSECIEKYNIKFYTETTLYLISACKETLMGHSSTKLTAKHQSIGRLLPLDGKFNDQTWTELKNSIIEGELELIEDNDDAEWCAVATNTLCLRCGGIDIRDCEHRNEVDNK